MTGLTTSFLTISGIWLVTVMMPGPNFVATVHGTVNGSLRDGLLVAVGLAIGTALWAIASLLGLGLLFESAGWLYLVVKAVAAGYLIFIGAKMVWAARYSSAMVIPASLAKRRVGPWRALRMGLLTDLSNPKAAAFFTSLFAVAVPAGAPVGFQTGIVAVVVGTALGWYMLVAVAVAAGPLARAYQRAHAVIQRAAGALFVGFGLKLLAER